ncbi:MAG: hypothetical protein K2H16_09680 [Prevotella sp.]|nr:hypothetical protein [Prevotella sp.]MDE6150876.1 hypothetical protein [Prevotella sp.]
MTTALLTLLVLVELARLALQYKSGKKYAERQEKTYCTTSDVENITSTAINEQHLRLVLADFGGRGYELASVVLSGNIYTLFFTKKKIKNFIENG